MKPYEHQEVTAKFLASHERAFDMSDPGVGKTRSTLMAYDMRPHPRGRMLVIAPKAILQPSWGEDIKTFVPHLKYSIANPPPRNRTNAFTAQTDIVLINHDGVKWLVDNQHLLEDFDTLVIDEFTAFKHYTSQRSRALNQIKHHFTYRYGLSGTPNSNTICDVWHPAFIIDDGERLGPTFYAFRAACCAPRQVGPQPNMIKWEDKPGAEEAVADLLKDITIRHVFEECVDIPENVVRHIHVDLPKRLMDQYAMLRDEAMLILKEGLLTVPHAGAKVKKLLQLVSGALYDNEGVPHLVHTDRYDLVTDLVEMRDKCIVAFNWKHQRDYLLESARKRKITTAVIDGDTKDKERPDIVEAFQDGQIKMLLCHPQSASHGLTLTRGTTTIWPSPTHNAEYFKQFNKRIYRAGQKRKTETILISARDTWEDQVYEALGGKLDRLGNFLVTIAT